jgi:hypothetical protein
MPPAQARTLTIAEAMCTLLSEQAGYARTVRSQAGTGGTRSVAAVTAERDALRQQVASRGSPARSVCGRCDDAGYRVRRAHGPPRRHVQREDRSRAHTYADQVGLQGRDVRRGPDPPAPDQVLQHPTGYYQSKITVERAGTGYRVTDQGVVYGPWLEGTGSRNAPDPLRRVLHVPPHEGARRPEGARHRR